MLICSRQNVTHIQLCPGGFSHHRSGEELQSICSTVCCFDPNAVTHTLLSYLQTKQSPLHGLDEFKYHNTIIPQHQMGIILAAAAEAVVQPLAARNFLAVRYLNEPIPLCDDPSKQAQP